MTRRAMAAVLLVLTLAVSVQADEDYRALFERAVAAIDADFENDWAYTETRVTRERVYVGRYDPRRPHGERWQLVSVNDRDPTAEEVDEYLEDKSDDDSNDSEERLETMVEADSIRLIEETAAQPLRRLLHALLGFDPQEDESFMDAIDATIRIDKRLGHLEYVDIRNHKTIRPAFGVRISKLVTRLTFGPAEPGGPVVPQSTQVEVKGRAYLLVGFDEEELTHYSDFEYAVVE